MSNGIYKQIFGEVLSGLGTTFTVAHSTIIDGSECIYRDGSRLGVGDYTILGKVITLTTALVANEILEVDYLYV